METLFLPCAPLRKVMGSIFLCYAFKDIPAPKRGELMKAILYLKINLEMTPRLLLRN
jgi:hypothetical protein